MFGVETDLLKQLNKLKRSYNILGIKAEFEAEGSSFRDLVRLRRITLLAGVKLYVKIGGVEAIRDIRDSVDIGVDGIIAPMVESKFGVKKFYEAIRGVYKDAPVHLSINIETKSAITHLRDILDYSAGRIHGITIGRTDLSGSYFNEQVVPDSNFLLKIIEEVAVSARLAGFTVTLGGSMSVKSLESIKGFPGLRKALEKLETRKVMIPTEKAIRNHGSLKEALKFEELYILSKKEICDLHIESEIARLTKLAGRR